jgi:hypothetical protein
MSVFSKGCSLFLIVGLTFSSGAAIAGDGWNGKWNAPLIAGGIAGLAIGALANSHPAQPAPPPPPPVGPPPPMYVESYYPPPCHWVRQPLYDAYGQYAGSRPVRVCD